MEKCEKCLYYKSKEKCSEDLINRQKAEIEKLKNQKMMEVNEDE